MRCAFDLQAQEDEFFDEVLGVRTLNEELRTPVSVRYIENLSFKHDGRGQHVEDSSGQSLVGDDHKHSSSPKLLRSGTPRKKDHWHCEAEERYSLIMVINAPTAVLYASSS